MSKPEILKISNAVVGYSDKKQISEIIRINKISAEKGEIIALIGINGAGKSSLLRTIVGTQNLLSGNIFIENINSKKISRNEHAKKIGFVSSEIIKANYLTVFDLVSLGRFPHTSLTGKLNSDDISCVKNALDTTGISYLKNSQINRISDGERQRAMIARALAQDTEIIILDEPASFLDIQNKYAVYGIMHKLAENKQKTIIFSTHDIGLALKFSDKFWLISDNKIIENSPEDIILSGIINNIFNNQSIYFDINTLDFGFILPLNKPVKLICSETDNKIYRLLENALNRNGFYIDINEKKIQIQIAKKQSNYMFTVNNKQFNNISETLVELKNTV